jgi:hypothetical protein
MSSKKRVRSAVASPADSPSLLEWSRRFDGIALDLGTGDARFACHLATSRPQTGVIAVDTCRANAQEYLRRAPDNLRFMVADASALPRELVTLADEMTINFPWGSLLRSLLSGDQSLLTNLPVQHLTIRVNGGAFAEAGFTYEQGCDRLLDQLSGQGSGQVLVCELDRDALRRLPSTWAKRLAFGRDPRAIELIRTADHMAHAAD